MLSSTWNKIRLLDRMPSVSEEVVGYFPERIAPWSNLILRPVQQRFCHRNAIGQRASKKESFRRA
jgi:hypothetical protein